MSKKVVKKLSKKLSKSCQKVAKKLQKSCQKGVKKLQKVVKKLSKNVKKLSKKLSKSCQKLSKSCQKVVKKLSKSCQKSCLKCDFKRLGQKAQLAKLPHSYQFLCIVHNSNFWFHFLLHKKALKSFLHSLTICDKVASGNKKNKNLIVR